MKNKLLKLSILFLCLLLPSCSTSNNTTSGNANSAISKTSPVSSNVSKTDDKKTSAKESVDSSTKKDDEVTWNASTLEAMSSYLSGYTSLSYPTGLPTTYTEASGTDEDGECFIVYDSTCGDLRTSYGNQLLDAGFIFDEEDSDDDYHYYSYQIEDSNDMIWIQLDYVSNVFEIFAWYEEGASQYESFPYSLVQTFLDIDNLDESSLPSFPLKTGEKYQAYSSGTEYLIIGGNYDASVEETAYVSSYETKLKAANYTIDKSYTAINSSLGIKVEYMIGQGVFYIQLSKYVPTPTGDHSLELIYSDFSVSYGDEESTITKDNITLKYLSVCYNNDYIQFRNKKKGSGFLYNETAISKLSSIVVTEKDVNNHQFYGVLSCYVSSSIIDDTNTGTSITPTYNNGVYTYTIPSNNSYFKLIDETDYASKNASIVINYSI